ncbi:hypothetical protein JW766_00240 [Candidatus Dojkabacteria bacterium]|nr:hypothetical protein [Candidatus Dojkabacteria bacterium]
MKSCFSGIRWILAVILASILFSVITVGITVISVTKVLTDSQNIKDWLSRGGVYDKLASVWVEIAKSEAGEELSEHVNLDEETELVESINEVFPPEWLKMNAEKIIDSVYVWLEGETEYPEFEIDLSDRSGIMIDIVTSSILDQIKALPECSQEEIVSMEGQDINPLELECLPPDYNLDEIDERMAEEFEKQEFFQTDVISSKEFFKKEDKDSNGFDKLNQLIKANYPIIKKLYIYIPLIILVFSLILFILVPKLSSKLMFIGIIWVLSGSSLLFGSLWGKAKIDGLYQEQMGKISGEYVEELIDLFRRPVELASASFRGEVRQYAMILVVLGFILALGGFILKFSKRRYYIDEEALKEASSKEESSPESGPEVRLK